MSVSGTRIFEMIAEKSGTGLGEKELVLPYGISNFINFCTRTGMIFASFLNIPCDYYDTHEANIFNDLFSPLYISNNPTPWCNQHLVLKFDLSSMIHQHEWLKE
ncbi:hypothetical protein RCL_jg21688.t1 [Rhizophagus clarus]|uniref:Uncharacterized protein n=1 Tax=Rhizophagus clarus TaxID=94130 RepID=A0A8H3KZA1_9GLOM|nr:hypothetical protein RCL_jg21688.t1 [Rhizophagus clarus]